MPGAQHLLGGAGGTPARPGRGRRGHAQPGRGSGVPGYRLRRGPAGRGAGAQSLSVLVALRRRRRSAAQSFRLGERPRARGARAERPAVRSDRRRPLVPFRPGAPELARAGADRKDRRSHLLSNGVRRRESDRPARGIAAAAAGEKAEPARVVGDRRPLAARTGRRPAPATSSFRRAWPCRRTRTRARSRCFRVGAPVLGPGRPPQALESADRPGRRPTAIERR